MFGRLRQGHRLNCAGAPLERGVRAKKLPLCCFGQSVAVSSQALGRTNALDGQGDPGRGWAAFSWFDWGAIGRGPVDFGQPQKGVRRGRLAADTAEVATKRYLRLMELVCRGYSWDDAALLASAPVPLACIFDTVLPGSKT